MVALSPIQPDDERFHPLARIIFHLAGRVAGSFWVKTCHFQAALVTIPASTMHITRHCLLCRHPLTAETRVRFPVEPPTAAINCHASSPGAAGWRLRWGAIRAVLYKFQKVLFLFSGEFGHSPVVNGQEVRPKPGRYWQPQRSTRRSVACVVSPSFSSVFFSSFVLNSIFPLRKQ